MVDSFLFGDLKKYVTNENICMSNNYMKKLSISLVIRERQIKIILRSSKDKKMDNTELAKGVEHLEHSHRARKSKEWCHTTQ